MHESMGSTFMFYILEIFIVLYIVFMCFAVSYAKVFRLKNNVINMLEQSQFVYESASERNDMSNKIDGYMSSKNYNYENNSSIQSNINNDCEKRTVEAGKKIVTKTGVCIVPVNSSKNRFYNVYAYIVYHFPFFNIDILIPVGGETELIPA